MPPPTLPAVLLLHGSADTPQAWQGVSARLGNDITIHAPALPPVRTELALDTDLPWLDRILADTGARVAAGHSYGALLALRWALAHPGRLDRLVLCEPIAWGMACGVPEVDARRADLERCLERFAAGDAERGLEWLVDYWNGAGFWRRLPDKVRAALAAGAPRTRAEVACGAADRTNAGELATLATPTCVLAGGSTTPESLTVARRLAAAIPGARLTVLAGAGHQFLRTHAGEVAEAVAEVSGSRAT